MQDNIHGRKMSTTLLWIISASTWGSDQTIRSNVQLNAARTENAVAKTPCLNPTGLYDPTKHKSILAVTYHLNRKQKSIFNATIPCPRTVPTEHGTITKHNLQRMNAIPYPQKKDVDNIVLNASLHPLQNRNFNSVFDVQRPFRAKGLRPTPQNRNILPQFLTSNVHFRKGCMQGAPQNRNFTSVLDGQHPFRAKGLRRTNSNHIFYLSSWRSTSISCERVAADTSKSQFYLGFGRPMCTKCCVCVSWLSGGTAPALRDR